MKPKPYLGGTYYLWQYVPSRPAAILFTVLFALGTSCIAWRAIRTRTTFSIPFIVGGLFELVGYAGRAAARDQTDKLGPYIIQSLLILVAPALFAASIYMTLGRVMRSVRAEHHSLVPVRWLTRAFVAGDVASFMVQCTGGGLLAVQSFSQQAAQDIILAALFIQIVMFGLFASTAVVFHVRMRRRPTTVSASLDAAAAATKGKAQWERTLRMLYGVSALIMVRSIFRVVEYVMGQKGYPLRHEWTIYVFDGVLMLGVVTIFGWRYPGVLKPPEEGQWEEMDSGAGAAHGEVGGGLQQLSISRDHESDGYK